MIIMNNIRKTNGVPEPESYIRQTFQRCQTRDTLNATFPATQHDTSKVVCNDLKITSALKSRKKSFYFLEFLFFTKGILGSRKMYGNKQLSLPISAYNSGSVGG